MLTLTEPFEQSCEIKHSRFLARAAPIDTPEQALAFLELVRDPEATHNCWAYRIGQAYRFSDDGEPGGTAGRPILGAIDAQHLDHVMVVVTRWFGGVKLGAGGLARAYGGVAAECLRCAPRREVVPLKRLVLKVSFEDLGSLHAVLERHSAHKVQEQYGEQGLTVEVELPAPQQQSLEGSLRDATRGRARVIERAAQLPQDDNSSGR